MSGQSARPPLRFTSKCVPRSDLSSERAPRSAFHVKVRSPLCFLIRVRSSVALIFTSKCVPRSDLSSECAPPSAFHMTGAAAPTAPLTTKGCDHKPPTRTSIDQSTDSTGDIRHAASVSNSPCPPPRFETNSHTVKARQIPSWPSRSRGLVSVVTHGQGYRQHRRHSTRGPCQRHPVPPASFSTRSRLLCESVLLSCSESVLLSCSNSPSWPSRSRCLASVVTHGQGCRSTGNV